MCNVMQYKRRLKVYMNLLLSFPRWLHTILVQLKITCLGFRKATFLSPKRRIFASVPPVISVSVQHISIKIRVITPTRCTNFSNLFLE